MTINACRLFSEEAIPARAAGRTQPAVILSTE
jgi:hypothetical protein